MGKQKRSPWLLILRLHSCVVSYAPVFDTTSPGGRINRRAQLSCGEGYVADNNRFGASDAAAVRAVQQQAGLQPVNGIVYRETWHALQAQCTDPCGCEKEE